MPYNHAEYMREYRKTHPEKRTAEGIKRRYEGQSQRRRERKLEDPAYAIKARARSHDGRTPAAHRAGEAVRSAVRAGRLIKPAMCQWCGRDGPIEAAHHDYEQPLNVTWLCLSCHRRYDRQPKGGYIRQACRP